MTNREAKRIKATITHLAKLGDVAFVEAFLARLKAEGRK